MKIKTIEKKIVAKLNQWLETITDENLRKKVKDNLLVSGGSIASMLMGADVNDYDVYLKDRDVLKSLAQYYIKGWSGIWIADGRERDKLMREYDVLEKEDAGEYDKDYFSVAIRNLKPDQIKLMFNSKNGGMRVNEDKKADELNYEPVYFSPNAISISNDIQIVLRFWGDSAKIHETFDFIHATNYFTFEEGLVRNLAAVESILTRTLRYQGSHYPVTSIIRAKKFIKRGFNIGAGEYLKIMFQISQLDLTDPDVLEEQLIGVDVAYFEMLIEALRAKFSADKDFQITAGYFGTLIDKIFNENHDDDETV